MNQSHSMRADIQALRGLAVLLVLVYHARLGLFHAGYLGVDIFFVISGFLITSMVKSQIEHNKFSFKEFYFRRAKRLLPAAYTTIFFTTILAFFLLTGTELKQYAQQAAGAISFTANYVLMRQGSYFGGDAELKPLLHTWSLSIEEQYYLILPALMFFINRRFWFALVIVAMIASFIGCVAIAAWKPQVAFYAFPTRAWELGVGSLGAFIVARQDVRNWAKWLFWPSLVALLVLPVYPVGGSHPGIDALIACFATLIVILRSHPALNGAAVKPLAWVGDISYSLYLVHWPLFALAANVWVGEAPYHIRLIIAVISMGLAWAQYHFIENPIRSAPLQFTWRRAAMTATLSLALAALPFALYYGNPKNAEYSFERRGNTGLGDSCVSDRNYAPPAQCMTTSHPDLMVWGDSYAMHLIPGIRKEWQGTGVIQATKYVCGPLIGLSPFANGVEMAQTRSWADGCLDYNDEVLEYLKNSPVKTVVLASVFKQYLTPEQFDVVERAGPGQPETEKKATPDAALQAAGRTITALRAMGKKVVVIAPPPALDWDAGMCSERILRGMPTYGDYADCSIPDAEYKAKRKAVLTFMQELQKRFDVDVIMFDDALRSGNGYRTREDGKIIYISNGHLSYTGSEFLAKQMHMGQLIADKAR
ncbi:acyltransferase [Pseudonocardia sp. TMWB2A]|uniref:acyltransferase family protein n=1 Tax=Pseudonocardia sp. TMWB2A TaxID=687430 RepID=UPI00307E9281